MSYQTDLISKLQDFGIEIRELEGTCCVTWISDSNFYDERMVRGCGLTFISSTGGGIVGFPVDELEKVNEISKASSVQKARGQAEIWSHLQEESQILRKTKQPVYGFVEKQRKLVSGYIGSVAVNLEGNEIYTR